MRTISVFEHTCLVVRSPGIWSLKYFVQVVGASSLQGTCSIGTFVWSAECQISLRDLHCVRFIQHAVHARIHFCLFFAFIMMKCGYVDPSV